MPYRMVEDGELKPPELDRNGNELPRLPFMRFNFMMSKKTQENKLGSIVRYDSIYFGMQEFFLQIETTILNDNMKFFVQVLDVCGQKEDSEILVEDEAKERQRMMKLSRDDNCPFLDASKGIDFNESLFQFDKISFGIIMISTIKTSLAFKLQRKAFNFDLSNPRAVGGNLSHASPLLTNFA